MAFDQVEMVAPLLRGKEAVDDGMDHRQQAVGDAGGSSARMQQVIDAPVVLKMEEAGEDAIDDQQSLKIRAYFCGLLLEVGAGPSRSKWWNAPAREMRVW
jgi:hypothetical protein